MPDPPSIPLGNGINRVKNEGDSPLYSSCKFTTLNIFTRINMKSVGFRLRLYPTYDNQLIFSYFFEYLECAEKHQIRLNARQGAGFWR